MSPRPVQLNPNPRVEVKLRIPLETIEKVKRILLGGQFKSAFINDFCFEAILEKLDKIQKDNKLEVPKKGVKNGQSSGS